MLVYNLLSPRSGEPVRNQFVIIDDGKTYFQSYESLIAVKYWEDGKTILKLGRDWDYSKTTMKYLHVWLNEYFPRYSILTAYEIRKLIKDGVILYDEDMA